MEIKNTTLRLRIRGIGYREHTLSLSDRLGIINKRLNNRGLLNGTRTGENVSENIFDRNHVSNITIVKLKKGNVIVPDSKSWNSTELGRDYLDLEIAGLAPTNKDLIQATLIELIKERLTGLNAHLPLASDLNQLDINVMVDPSEIISQPSLRNKELETAYKTSLILPSVNALPSVSEEGLKSLLEEGGFNVCDNNEKSTPIHKLITALSILSPLERGIISNRFEIGAKFQTRKQIGASLSVSREMIGQREARILRYFRNLNRERDINLDKSGDK